MKKLLGPIEHFLNFYLLGHSDFRNYSIEIHRNNSLSVIVKNFGTILSIRQYDENPKVTIGSTYMRSIFRSESEDLNMAEAIAWLDGKFCERSEFWEASRKDAEINIRLYFFYGK